MTALDQTYSDYEVLVVDDCSPDPVYSLVSKLTQPKLRYIKTSSNLGRNDPSATFNFGLNHANGEYVVLLGDDDRLSLNFLSEMNQLIERHPAGVIFRSRLAMIDSRGDVFRIGMSLPEEETWDEYLYSRFAHSRDGSGSEMCVKIEALRGMGGYVSMPMALGSDDLTWISLCLIKPIISTNGTFAYWRRHEHSISFSAGRRPEVNRWVCEEHKRLIELIKNNQPSHIESRLLVKSVNDAFACYLSALAAADEQTRKEKTYRYRCHRLFSVLASLIVPSFFEVKLKRVFKQFILKA